MTTPKATHPPAPLVPARLKKEDWVFLTGPNAGVFSGLYKFKFENLDGAENATLPITRGDPDRVYFQVHPSFEGDYEVKGLFIDASGAKDERSFGKTQIS